MLRIGIVGLGGISKAHLAGWNNIEGAEVTAVCDVREERFEGHSDKRCYTSYDEMLEKEEFDIVDVCVPTYLHIEFSLKAINKGINVICEKPISLNPADVSKVYEAAERNGVKFMVAMVTRFMPQYDYVKKVFDSGKYGRLLSGTMERNGRAPTWSFENWMLTESKSGLIPYDVHVHDLDFLIYAFGKPKNHFAKRSKTEASDYLNVIYDFGDFFINVEGAWYNAPGYPFAFTFKFEFEKAVLAYTSGGKFLIYEEGGSVVDLSPGKANDTGDIGLPASNAYEDELRYFFGCVRDDKPVEMVKPQELINALKIVEKIKL